MFLLLLLFYYYYNKIFIEIPELKYKKKRYLVSIE